MELLDVAGEARMQEGDFAFLSSAFSCSFYPIMLFVSCSVLLFSNFLLDKFSVMVSSFHVYNSFNGILRISELLTYKVLRVRFLAVYFQFKLL